MLRGQVGVSEPGLLHIPDSEINSIMIRFLTSGESHGEALVGIVEGMPAGVPLRAEDINRHLRRRWQGYGRGGRAKIESDVVHIVSGVRFSKTLGSPIALSLQNAAHHKDRSNWERVMAVEGSPEGVDKITLPRPGHADLVGVQKYSYDDIRPVIERASARETAMRVACCCAPRILLKALGVEVGSHVLGIGTASYDSMQEADSYRMDHLRNGAEALFGEADKSEVRVLSPQVTRQCIDAIKTAKESGDSLGGVYEVIATGVPPGLGSYVHWDRRIDGLLAQAILSIPGQKAVEIGDGIRAARDPGSKVHDPIAHEDGRFVRSSNSAGGVEGGVTNGMPLVIRGYMKPIPTLIQPLQTVDVATREGQPTRYERSDITSVPAASTVAEAMVAYVLANAVLEKYGGDSLGELRDRFPTARRT